MNQRAELSEQDRAILAEAVQHMDESEATMAEHRRRVAAVVERTSYREVARLTGLSTNTLQRWVRESRASP